MNNTVSEVLGFVKENDVNYVRLGFCDLLGLQKNIAIPADELPAAFEYGVSFDCRAVRGFSKLDTKLFLFPDPDTITVLPWRPGPGRTARFFCDIKTKEGAPYARDSRAILKRVIKRGADMGYACSIGLDCEFYLFKTDEDGEPTLTTLDKGGYLDIAPLDKGEDMRREICLTLEEMGIMPETAHHEQGPGQNEIDLQYTDALRCADNYLACKTVIKKIAQRGGAYASFLPKPISSATGSNLQMNFDVSKDGSSIFSAEAGESFIAGILTKASEMTIFLNPLHNSYDRFGVFDAPGDISQMIRVPGERGGKHHIEILSPDSTVNPYLAFSLIISAGLDGIEQNLTIPKKRLGVLPNSLKRAVNLAKESEFVEQVVGKELLNRYLRIKESEPYDMAAAFPLY